MDEEKKEKENDPGHDENIQPADIEKTCGLLVRSRKQLVDIENNRMNQMTERKKQMPLQPEKKKHQQTRNNHIDHNSQILKNGEQTDREKIKSNQHTKKQQEERTDGEINCVNIQTKQDEQGIKT